MSQLDQAKKEAKRLFNLAKESSATNQKNVLEINNLSHAREILSIVNGYKSWHEYEEILKRKDLLLNKIDNNSINYEHQFIYDNQQYYIQDIVFNLIKTSTVNNKKLIIDKGHKNIILGRFKERTLFETKEQKWLLNNYPVLINGSTGAGKTETLLSLASQYIENGEGIIYMNGNGEHVIYNKFFGYASKFNRIEDLYCLNCISHHNLSSEDNVEEKMSHSIDPINPMLGDDEYFERFFGRLGRIIHAILKEINAKSQLMDIESLESILMLNNLINWHTNNTFNNNEIANYLSEIGLVDDEEDTLNEILLKHAELSHTAFTTVKILKAYSNIFKVDCSIDMEKIFLERKMLLILMPAFERSLVELQILGEVIVSQIKYIENKYMQYKTHFQNIILDEFVYFADSLKTLKINETKNNYIFGSTDFYNPNEIFLHAMANAKTTVIMKMNEPDFHNKIKLELINNLKELPTLKHKQNSGIFIKDFLLELHSISEGEAYVLSNNNFTTNNNTIMNSEKRYYCNYLRCEYLPPKYEKNYYLPQQARRLIEK